VCARWREIAIIAIIAIKALDFKGLFDCSHFSSAIILRTLRTNWPGFSMAYATGGFFRAWVPRARARVKRTVSSARHSADFAFIPTA
jgi:hypothetical protein